MNYVNYYLLKLEKFFLKMTIEPVCALLVMLFIPFIKIYRRLTIDRTKLPRLMWGPEPLINNKYYSQCMKKAEYKSTTLMSSYFNVINKKDDFDLYYSDFKLFYSGRFKFLRQLNESFFPYLLFLYSLFKFDIFHFSFSGGLLSKTLLKRMEAQLTKFSGCKIVSLAYGGDFYVSSNIIEPCWQHTILIHYPNYALNELEIKKRVDYWNKRSDIIINGMQIDGLGRWSVLPFRSEVIDIDKLPEKIKYSNNDGKNAPVCIAHAPNHRFIKGTEYLEKAIDDLREEGYDIEFVLIEKMQNSELLELLSAKADILFDQINLGYAMSAIEGFAIGLPVMTNLENREYVRLFQRYSYLEECPAVSISHETLTDSLRSLIKSPQLRKELGEAGKRYAKKYHSFQTGKYLFGKVYDKIWQNKDVDLLNMFHPLLKESYNNQSPKVKHPLVKNKIPVNLL